MIDWKLSISLTGSEKNAKDYLLLLTQDVKKQMTLIQEAYVLSDKKKILFLLHRLRGALYFFGAPRLQEITALLEKAIQDKKDLDRYFKKFEQAIQTFLEESKKFVGGANTSSR